MIRQASHSEFQTCKCISLASFFPPRHASRGNGQHSNTVDFCKKKKTDDYGTGSLSTAFCPELLWQAQRPEKGWAVPPHAMLSSVPIGGTKGSFGKWGLWMSLSLSLSLSLACLCAWACACACLCLWSKYVCESVG